MKTKVDAQKIKKLREQRGWSQNQLSEMSALSLRTIQRMEKDGDCSMESVKSLAAVFELDFKELLEAENSKKFEGTDFLTRIEHGKQIADLLGDKEASDCDFDIAINEKNSIELIHSLFQTTQDFNDIWHDIEYDGRGEAMNEFQRILDDLGRKDLWVFGGQTKRAIGDYQPPLIFNILCLRVYPKDSPTIIKFDLAHPSVSSVNSN